MKHQVRIEDTGEQYACDERESVLVGMARMGKRGIPLGCRGGGCGVCKVRITSGSYRTLRMSSEHISPNELADGIVLACRVMAESDLSLQVVGKLSKAIFWEGGASG